MLDAARNRARGGHVQLDDLHVAEVSQCPRLGYIPQRREYVVVLLVKNLGHGRPDAAVAAACNKRCLL